MPQLLVKSKRTYFEEINRLTSKTTTYSVICIGNMYYVLTTVMQICNVEYTQTYDQ